MNKKKILQGVVVSNKMDKTLVVLVSTKLKHPIYGKFVNRSTKYYVHDEESRSKIGDIVKIVETRPYSKLKNYKLS